MSEPTGVYEEVGGRPQVRFERRLRHPVEKVWSALTTPERVADWMGDLDIEPRVGGRYVIGFSVGGLMEGTLTEWDPPRRLKLIWREAWFEGDSCTLAYELEPRDGGTLLTLTHSYPPGFDGFEYLPGWEGFLDGLEQVLDGGGPINWKTKMGSGGYEASLAAYRAKYPERAKPPTASEPG